MITIPYCIVTHPAPRPPPLLLEPNQLKTAKSLPPPTHINSPSSPTLFFFFFFPLFLPSKSESPSAKVCLSRLAVMTLLPCCVGKREAVVGMSAHPAATCWSSRDGWDCEIFNFCLHFWSSTVPVLLHLHLHFCAVFCRDTGEKKGKRGKTDRELLYDSFQEKGCGRGSPPTAPRAFFFHFFFQSLIAR